MVMASGLQWLPDDWWTVEDVIKMYRQWISGQAVALPDGSGGIPKCYTLPPPPSLEPLRGKNLACWCKPDARCHADVLLELANRTE